jgi:hypothetical protein
VFENRVLRRIFGPKRYEVTGEWRKLHNEELHEIGRACNTNGEKNAISILLEKLEEKRLLERTRHRWADNIKMDLGEIGWGGMGSIDLASGYETGR